MKTLLLCLVSTVALADATTFGVTLYVDTTGNDSNACTAPGASACRTPMGALAKIQKTVRHPVLIQLGAGIMDGFTIDGFTVERSGSLSVSGTTAQASTGSATSTVTGAMSTATFTTVEDASQAWAADSLKLRLMAVGNAAGAVDLFPVSGNSATVASIVYVGPVPQQTTYTVHDWATELSGPVIVSSNMTWPGGITLSALKIKPTVTGVGVLVQRSAGTVLSNMLLEQGSSGTVLQLADTGSITVKRSVIKGTAFGIAFDIGHNTNLLATNNILQSVDNANGFFFSGLSRVTANQMLIEGPAYGFKIQAPVWVSLVGVRMKDVLHAVRVKQSDGYQGSAFVHVQSGLDISGSGTAIELTGPSFMTITGQLTGSGNTTGIQLAAGARLQLAASAALGASQEVLMDGASFTYAAMRSATPKLLTTPYFTVLHE